MCDDRKQLLSDIADIKMGSSPGGKYVSEENEGIPFISGNSDLGDSTPATVRYCTKPKKFARPGDTIITVRAPVGDVNRADGVYCLGRGVAAVRFERVDPRYGWHLLRQKASDLARYAQGTTFLAVKRADLEGLRVTVPSPSQQRRIATILDTVDRAIRKTEEVIDKLEQMKRGLLHDLLTRGIDEHGELRDPQAHPEQFKETELGLIPKEWEPKRLDEVADISYGLTLGRTKREGEKHVEMPYLRVANVKDGYLDLDEVKTIEVPEDHVAKYRLQAGDVLMTEGGDFDKLGRGTVWRGEIAPCLHQNHVFRVRPNRDRLAPRFLDAITSSRYGKKYFLLSSKQTTNLASINKTQLSAFPVPLPGLGEQQAIAGMLACKDRDLEAQRAALEKLCRIKQGLTEDLL